MLLISHFTGEQLRLSKVKNSSTVTVEVRGKSTFHVPLSLIQNLSCLPRLVKQGSVSQPTQAHFI